MKLIKLSFLILFGFLIAIVTLAISNIPTITISRQSQLDSLTALRIDGNLIINGPDISHLDSLYGLTSINGFFEIRNNPSLTSINGLSHLDSVAGNFVIQNNSNLANINDLSGLTFIGGGLRIDSNYALLSLDGPSQIDSVRGGLTIVNNPALENINGFSNLTNIGGGLTIDSNYALLNIDALSHLTFIGGGLTIDSNASLENLNGLSNLISVEGNLTIQNNTSLSDYNGLFTLLNGNGLSGAYNSSGNAVNLTEADILIEGLISLINNSGIPNGTKNSLVSLLKNSEKSLEKFNNGAAINQLEAFINEIEAQSGKKIDETTANEWIATAQRTITVISTSLAKNNSQETLNSNRIIPQNYSLDQNYPNPFNPSTSIKYALPRNEKVTIDIYDLLGRKVAELVNGEVEAGYHEVKFNADNLASGIYFYRLNSGSFTQVNKMLLIK